ncbi:MerR family transcriptional regulator [Agrobacterium sp. BA1120]|uniref:MerR family transcriptional regulator n=1 Tax=Agrobacterium sp. BA1120 TaxID=3228927 RepID=UPI003369DA49
MRDSEEPTKSPTRDVSKIARKGFLPEVSLPSPLPPEPVAIADMANMFGVTHRTLHFYEEKEIISSRRAGLMRIYSHQDVHRMAVINFCREIGIPVATIQDIMQKLADAPTQADADALFQDVLNNRKSELAAEISTVRRQIQQISDVLTDDDALEAEAEVLTEADVELSTQERKCLELMAEGYAPVRLARTLGISNDELQKLESCVMEKVSASNRFQAVAKAYMMGVIQPAS